MVFSSLSFICIFLPVVFFLHSVLPGIKAKNALLIPASILFYAFGEPVYVILILISSLVNYLLALGVNKEKKSGKALLVLAVVFNLALLGVFKYTDMLLSTVNALLHLHIPLPGITLPIGISFFTFQSMSYVIDVYRAETPRQKNYGKLLLYISFFPQLIAGPIVKYHDICDAIDHRTVSWTNAAPGMRRFAFGLAKKVIIANAMAAAADTVFGTATGELNVLSAWIGAVSYMLQIYFDFSGYSDMAIGMGKMFGFTFKENFDYPYAADSIRTFWRRWHISLSTWFREYLYIPLGGNRKGKARTILNRMIVFFCTGLWHGANWTFVVWGLFHGLLLTLESSLPFFNKLPKMLRRLWTLLMVCLGFVIFRADTLSAGLGVIGKMFAGFDFSAPAMQLGLSQLTPWFVFALVLGAFAAQPWRPMLERRLAEHKAHARVWSLCGYAVSVLLLVLCLVRLSGDAYNPFIYFRF